MLDSCGARNGRLCASDHNFPVLFLAGFTFRLINKIKFSLVVRKNMRVNNAVFA